jgi:TRAP-type mannitol/chloroaromatic compound transport system permease large subunit
LIVLADQLGVSVGDMYAGAMVPGLLLVGLFMLMIVLLAIFRPKWVAHPADGGAHLPERKRLRRVCVPAGHPRHFSCRGLCLGPFS